MKCLGRISAVAIFVVSTSSCSYVFGRTVTLKVEDQGGNPVPEAQVGMGFLRSHKGDSRDGVTNENGIVKMRGRDLYGVKIHVTKPGYYRSERRTGPGSNFKTSIVLKEKLNPIPMYVKEVSLGFPKENVALGFDFRAGDWVAPWGDGENAHAYFSFEGDKRSTYDKEGVLEVQFSNDKGGLKKIDEKLTSSAYKFPYKAPVKGYASNVVHTVKRRRLSKTEAIYESTLDEDSLGYVFKVVTEVNDDGDPEESFYGKVKGEFVFSPLKEDEEGDKGFVRFTYYFNPNPNDRNIEFDPSRNLFDDIDATFPP